MLLNLKHILSSGICISLGLAVLPGIAGSNQTLCPPWKITKQAIMDCPTNDIQVLYANKTFTGDLVVVDSDPQEKTQCYVNKMHHNNVVITERFIVNKQTKIKDYPVIECIYSIGHDVGIAVTTKSKLSRSSEIQYVTLTLNWSSINGSGSNSKLESSPISFGQGLDSKIWQPCPGKKYQLCKQCITNSTDNGCTIN